MKVKDLIKLLESKNPEAVVHVFDPLLGKEFLPVVSADYNDTEVHLYPEVDEEIEKDYINIPVHVSKQPITEMKAVWLSSSQDGVECEILYGLGSPNLHFNLNGTHVSMDAAQVANHLLNVLYPDERG